MGSDGGIWVHRIPFDYEHCDCGHLHQRVRRLRHGHRNREPLSFGLIYVNGEQ